MSWRHSSHHCCLRRWAGCNTPSSAWGSGEAEYRAAAAASSAGPAEHARATVTAVPDQPGVTTVTTGRCSSVTRACTATGAAVADQPAATAVTAPATWNTGPESGPAGPAGPALAEQSDSVAAHTAVAGRRARPA